MTPLYKLSPERREPLYEAAQAALCIAYAAFLLIMPLSRAIEQITSISMLGFLVVSYILYPERAAIRSFPWRWPYVVMLAYFLLNCFLSIQPWISLGVLRNASHVGFLMLLSGLEIGGRPRLAAALPWVLSILAFYQGVDGVWQSITGIDPIRGTPILTGRLTAAFKTYRVGDLLGMALAASLSLPFIMPRAWSMAKRVFICAVLWLPAFYTFIFAQARSGYICLFVALAAFYALHKGVSWRWVVPLLIGALLMITFGFERVSIEAALRDGRFKELWPLGWRMFLENPVLGSGVGTYKEMYQSLGVDLPFHKIDINHPHNIYLQLLCETGLIGFILFCLFLFPTLYWGWKTLRKNRPPSPAPAAPYGGEGGSASDRARIIWKVAAACWSVSAGYAVMGLFPHSLFRTWWLALAFSFLGIMAGGCIFLQSLAKQAGKTATPR